MIERVDDKVVKWAGAAVAPAAVAVVGTPTDADAGVQVMLTDAGPYPMARGVFTDVGLLCRYRLFTSADDPRASHELLGRLLVAVADAPVVDGARLEFDADAEPLDPAWWVAVGVKPRPALAVRVKDRLSRDREPARPVVGPVRVDFPRTGVLRGVVVGARGIPVTGATVTVPPFPAVYRTDARGRFETARLPLTDSGTRVEVRAKGQVQQTVVSDDRPVTVVFEGLGGTKDEAGT